jgi:hypothetical protein
MADDEEEEDRSRHRHDCFFAVGRLPETRRSVLARSSDCSTHRACPALDFITSGIPLSRGCGRPGAASVGKLTLKTNLYYWWLEEAASTFGEGSGEALLRPESLRGGHEFEVLVEEALPDTGQRYQARYFRVKHGAESLDEAIRRESATCCGVNLAVQYWAGSGFLPRLGKRLAVVL